MKRFLVIGSGAREHAIAWKLSQEAIVHVAPGNAGIAKFFECHSCSASDSHGIERIAKEIAADCVVIGPEDPLIAGVADKLRRGGHIVFGPGADGAMLEGSKAFSKIAMMEAGVPTAAYEVFTDPASAAAYAKSQFDSGMQIAVKASGAALGKGVVVCTSLDMAEDAIASMMVEKEFGDAGTTVVIEERLVGREFSLIALVSRGEFRCFAPVQDYKRALNSDRGPNTGGMGAVCTPLWLSPEIVEKAKSEIIEPMVRWLCKDGIDYRGALFAGVLVQDDQPYCLEYNTRFGDPEAQCIMRRTGVGLADAVISTAQGIEIPSWEGLNDPSVTVVLASGGYPQKTRPGQGIEIGELPRNVQLFWGGVRDSATGIETAGGRVVSVSATGKSVEFAQKCAYEGVEAVRFDGKQYRTDIGD